MKKFLAIYTGTATSAERSEWDKLDPAKRQELERSGMAAWGKWMTDNQKSLVDAGGPLGKTKRTSRDGVSDIKNAMAGYVVLTAESHEAAARLFENHPHFAIFPGEAVEIMECLPVPGQ
jgi:hypothetical protein